MKTLLFHFPALGVMIPFFGALIVALIKNERIAWLLSTGTILFSTILSILALGEIAHTPYSYSFGGWHGATGIEYKIDSLNQPIIVILNLIILFFLLFTKELMTKTVTTYIETNRRNLIYSLLLFAHTGYIGVISTNDLFNAYVFIEISSLATYVLISKGRSKMALVGAFDYLILGTIGATLILIAIGFLFAKTGSLNITDIHQILKDSAGSNKLVITSVVFFITGCILKMSFFPMHFWMIRAYNNTSPILLTYFAAISSFFGIYLILRFLEFVIDNQSIILAVSFTLKYLAIITIILCTFLALLSKNLKSIIIYSTASQIGYSLLLLNIPNTQGILFQMLLLDTINKIAAFTMLSHMQIGLENANIFSFKMGDIPQIQENYHFKLLYILTLLFSASTPVTSMFFIKIKIFDTLLKNNLFLEFIVVLAGSLISLLYHLKMAKPVLFNHYKAYFKIDTKLYGLTAIVIIQILTLIYINDIARFAGFIQSTIIS